MSWGNFHKGIPGAAGRVMNVDQVCQALRAGALAADDANHDLRELAFRRWRSETVFPAAVDSWLLAVAENSK